MKLMRLIFLCGILAGTSSCVNQIHDDESNVNKKINITLSYNKQSLNSVAMRGSTDVADNAKAIYFADFMGGEKMSEITQTASDKNFGKISFNLEYGTHRIVAIAHNSDAIKMDYPLISLNKLKDTFIISKEITVNDETPTDINLSLDRCIGKIYVVADDAIPNDISALKVTVGDYYPSFDVEKEVSAGVPAQEIRTFTYTQDVRGMKGTNYSIYCFVPKGRFTTSVKLEVLGAKGEVKRTINLSDISISINHQTVIKGDIFSRSGTGTIAVVSSWDDEIIYKI